MHPSYHTLFYLSVRCLSVLSPLIYLFFKMKCPRSFLPGVEALPHSWSSLISSSESLFILLHQFESRHLNCIKFSVDVPWSYMMEKQCFLLLFVSWYFIWFWQHPDDGFLAFTWNPSMLTYIYTARWCILNHFIYFESLALK